MKKFVRRVIKSFKRFADANLLAFGQNVSVSMADAVDVFPTPVRALGFSPKPFINLNIFFVKPPRIINIESKTRVA